MYQNQTCIKRIGSNGISISFEFIEYFIMMLKDDIYTNLSYVFCSSEDTDMILRSSQCSKSSDVFDSRFD